MNISEELYKLQDKKYKDFSSKLTPNVDKELFIGVRVPLVRNLAKNIYKDGHYEDFLNDLPHRYFDENMLHGLIISEIKDYKECLYYLDKFLPFVDNWAVCDIMSPKCFKNKHEYLIEEIKRWTASDHTYTARFGIGMLMGHYLDKEFKEDYLKIPCGIKIEDYYMKMMNAWYYATALAKQWDRTIIYLENNILDIWTHNKTISKARESYRISADRKAYLKTLKR